MKTIEIKLFKFEELSEKAQENAIHENSNINLCFDWYESTKEDAQNIGLKITSFDLDRNRHAEGRFLINEQEVAGNIILNHGEECETYKTAKRFLIEFKELISNEFTEDQENEQEKNDELINDLKADFLNEILEDYSVILQKEYEYLSSSESITDTLLANDYDYTEKGEIY